MDDVAELLKTWELHDLVPIFTEQRMTIQALSALTREDLKDLIPQAGPRVLFTRCWRSWKNEFLPINDTSIPSFSGLDLSNLQFDCLKETDELSECVVEVLNKRRRFQQLGSLTTKKRNREESPGPSSSSPRPMPRIKNKFIVIKTLVGKQLRFI
ncbi:uncharacterized protein LOC133522724 [Cydia pomonella]|uniref:uncharacterized protein LOC133522724 n=1 Tax=Cydia pomonella TaxID=82600 RepID=UPI002ADE7F41|nr:uncharacterized protein LOC133522724 [Cydia pomonella]